MRPERALLSGMVDYAGLFPPAQLPLEKAVREYAVHLGGAEAWVLGRFIIPAQRLEELEPHLVLFSETFRVVALGKGGRSEDEYLKNLNRDLNAIETFRTAHGAAVSVESFEASDMRLVAGIDNAGYWISRKEDCALEPVALREDARQHGQCLLRAVLLVS